MEEKTGMSRLDTNEVYPSHIHLLKKTSSRVQKDLQMRNIILEGDD